MKNPNLKDSCEDEIINGLLAIFGFAFGGMVLITVILMIIKPYVH